MWTWFKNIIFICIQFFAEGKVIDLNGNLATTLPTFGDWGLAIILVTVIIRLLLTPLTSRQYRSTYEMQKMQPLIQELQEKYADDRVRLNEEMTKIYAENKYSPLRGCLPLLIQMPIFIALYQVLLDQIPNGASFFNIIPNLTISPSGIYSQGFLILLPYLVLLALFAVSMVIPMLMQSENNNSMTKVMTTIMVLMMLWFGWVAPAGVILFWDASAYIGIGQQFFIRRHLKHQDEKEEEQQEAVEVKPVQVSVERREHKKRPHKKH